VDAPGTGTRHRFSVIAATGGAIVLLSVHNVVIERLAPWMYVPACLTVAAGVVGLGAMAGLSAGDMGLTIHHAQPGAGLVVGLAVVGSAMVVAAAALPTTRRLFADRRMAGVGPAGTAYRAVVRIPLGTVLLEEVAFRGVLLGLLGTVVPLGWAVAVSCVLFGLWHIVPTAALLDVNCVARDRALILAGSVAAMAAAGLLLCWLRLATGGVATPAAIHVSVTATATVAASVVQRSSKSHPVCT
jgi:membrane protease YdiL (CAAX protease family)